MCERTVKKAHEMPAISSEVACHQTEAKFCIQLDQKYDILDKDEIQKCGKLASPLSALKFHSPLCTANCQSDSSTGMHLTLGIITDALS